MIQSHKASKERLSKNTMLVHSKKAAIKFARIYKPLVVQKNTNKSRNPIMKPIASLTGKVAAKESQNIQMIAQFYSPRQTYEKAPHKCAKLAIKDQHKGSLPILNARPNNRIKLSIRNL